MEIWAQEDKYRIVFEKDGVFWSEKNDILADYAHVSDVVWALKKKE